MSLEQILEKGKHLTIGTISLLLKSGEELSEWLDEMRVKGMEIRGENNSNHSEQVSPELETELENDDELTDLERDVLAIIESHTSGIKAQGIAEILGRTPQSLYTSLGKLLKFGYVSKEQESRIYKIK